MNKPCFMKILPPGFVFSTGEDDEFKLDFRGQTHGVFKTFEYLSLPFSYLEREDLFRKLLAAARENGTSFSEELLANKAASALADDFFQRMRQSPGFSKQVIEYSLSRVYVKDNLLSKLDCKQTLEGFASKVVIAWNELSDFYCIEGLVGGNGQNNLFEEGESGFSSGVLDTLETVLPAIKQRLDFRSWKKVCLKISSLVSRDYIQIEHGSKVLEHIYGVKDLSDDEVREYLSGLDKLVAADFERNKDHAKFFNSIIRFHNWLPLNIKLGGQIGDVYDGICASAKEAVRLVSEELSAALEKISDATSPKGLAIVKMIDEGLVGNRDELSDLIVSLEQKTKDAFESGRSSFNSFSFHDPSFYSGLVGGKWKGIKLLNDAKIALGLNYEVPDGFVFSSIQIEDWLKSCGALDLINPLRFDEEARLEVLRRIDQLKLDVLSPAALGDLLIVRSSMYGEDGASNFSGTYDSKACTRETFGQAIKDVMKSYYSKEAVLSREDVGLSHKPMISLVVQEKISGRGGVINLTKDSYSISFADTAENAVNGNGSHHYSNSLREVVRGTALEDSEKDFLELQEVFGNSDIEFIISDRLYLTQLRPKRKVEVTNRRVHQAEHINVSTASQLRELELDKEYIVNISFFSEYRLAENPDLLMEFIRRNRKNILAVEGDMPSVAHIPNKIEGHFKIPYIRRSEAYDKN